ncbi:MAG: DNA mismatch repair endonuclease MutL [Firmicutes bacterium]|nr:DNA mismatch repair endonuclease MutL [Bacillota bacterium]
MSVIKVMSENLANKIAAGEVVEKCASVVKELVENSIDAKAQSIKINLLKGGLEEITVIDDGTGMDESDAILAFQRHATSKIYKDDDLFFIDTLGFRGEALPSIASVSEVVLETCQKDVGTLIHIKGGMLIEKSNSSARIGTRITITNLFFNTPARLKYLKSEQTELANTVSFIEKLSLAKPDISFTLTNNGSVIVKTSGSGNLIKTIHEIYGLQVSSKMLEIKALNDDFEIKGFICKPEILKASRNHLITFINGRVVKNNDINRAINDAYYTYKPDGKYPIVVINIETDPTLVDVNIHPTKQDVKLSKIDSLYNLIYETMKRRLYDSLLIPDAISKKDIDKIKDSFAPVENYKEVEIKQTTFDFGENNSSEVVKNEEFKSLVLYPIGLAHGTYIICENDEGLYLLDQHAAQERVNYEKYLENLKNEAVNITSMLVPINIEFSQSEYITFVKNSNIFENMGFEWVEFGINTVSVKAHPTWLKTGYEEESIRKIIDLIITMNNDFDVIKFRENVAITLACKMAIKANEHISMMEIEGLLKNLVKCDNPYNCPHGRPTIIKFSIYDLEKMFKRAMN